MEQHVLQESDKIKAPFKSETDPKGFELHDLEILDPISVVDYVSIPLGYQSQKPALRGTGPITDLPR